VQPLAILALCLSPTLVYPVLAATAGSRAAASAQALGAPQRSWLLFIRDHKVWAVTSDGAQTKGPLAIGEPVIAVYPSPDGRYLAASVGDEREVRIFRVLPDLQLAEAKGPQPRLTRPACWGWSPDGEYLAIGTRDDGGLHILRMMPDLEVAEVQVLRPGLVRVEACWWSPNGRYLTISTDPRTSGLTPGGERVPPPSATPDDDRLGARGAARTEQTVHILAWRARGRRWVVDPLVLPPLLSLPLASVDWSPKSDAVAYPRPTANPNVRSDAILVTDVPSGHTREILAAEQSFFLDLCWSADGRLLTWDSHDGIRSIPADGSEREGFLVQGKGDWFAYPRWSPDGAYLAYARSWKVLPVNPAPLMSFWVRDMRSGGSTRLTGDNVLVAEDSLVWSPDGTLVSFFANFMRSEHELGEDALCVADPATGAVTRVAGGLPSSALPAVWLPAGVPPGEDD